MFYLVTFTEEILKRKLHFLRSANWEIHWYQLKRISAASVFFSNISFILHSRFFFTLSTPNWKMSCSFCIVLVTGDSKYVKHSVCNTWQMEREVYHALCTNGDLDRFYHLMVKSPKNWCSTSIIELLEHTLNLCLNHFSNENITGFNTILIVTSIVIILASNNTSWLWYYWKISTKDYANWF